MNSWMFKVLVCVLSFSTCSLATAESELNGDREEVKQWLSVYLRALQGCQFVNNPDTSRSRCTFQQRSLSFSQAATETLDGRLRLTGVYSYKNSGYKCEGSNGYGELVVLPKLTQNGNQFNGRITYTYIIKGGPDDGDKDSGHFDFLPSGSLIMKRDSRDDIVFSPTGANACRFSK
jgi:hypothetical protein